MLKFKASFDDGCTLDTRVADLLEQYGFHPQEVIFYIPSAWEHVNRTHGDEPLSLEQLFDLARRFKIGSHTITHPMLTRITLGQAYDEIIQSRQSLQDLFGFPITDFCYPRGYANEQLRTIVRKNYETARNTLVGNLLPPEDPVWETPTVHVGGKRRKEYEGTTWLAEGRRLLNEAVRLNGDNPDKDYIYHLWGHSWEINREAGWEDLETLLKEIQAVRS